MSAYTPETIVWRMSLVANLQNLPLEILELIFKDLIIPLNYCGPLATAVNPYIPSSSYEKLDLSYPQLLQLCRLINGSSHLARVVVELRCDSADRNVDYRPEDEKILFDFFRSATSLTTLQIRRCPRLQSRLLSVKFALASYRNLTQLSLHSYSSDPLRSPPHHYQYLSSFRRLERLEISWESDYHNSDLLEQPFYRSGQVAQFKREDRAAIQSAGAGETTIESLDLATVSLNHEGTVELLKQLTRLGTLRLTISSGYGRQNLRALLATVNPNLSHLDIAFFPYNMGSPSTELLLLPNLVSLHLYDRRCSPALLLALSNLTKLQRLSFRDAPDYTTLRQLVTAPMKPPALAQLVVRFPYATKGVSHLDRDYYLNDYYDAETGAIQIGPGWFEASWGGGNGIQEILDEAQESGIQLEGDWSGARSVARMHQAELDWCSTFRIEENRHLRRYRRSVKIIDNESSNEEPSDDDRTDADSDADSDESIDLGVRRSNEDLSERGESETEMESEKSDESEPVEEMVRASGYEWSETDDSDRYVAVDGPDASEGEEVEIGPREAEIDVDTFYGESKDHYVRHAERSSEEPPDLSDMSDEDGGEGRSGVDGYFEEDDREFSEEGNDWSG